MPATLPTSRPYTHAARAIVLALLLPLVVDAQTSSPQPGIRHVATRGLTLVVRADGSVMGWGRDANGQPADRTTQERVFTIPLSIDLPARALQVALGESWQLGCIETERGVLRPQQYTDCLTLTR